MGMFDRKQKKYTLIKGEKQNPRDETTDYHKERVYRLKALRDIPEHGVKAGDLGGLVTSKDNLSHDGSCWIGYDAEVFGSVYVSDNAYIGDKASIRGGRGLYGIFILKNARITGNVIIVAAKYTSGFTPSGRTYITDEVHIYGNALLDNVLKISKNAKIHGAAVIRGVKEITDNSEIFGATRVSEGAIILGDSKIHGKARIEENATIRDSDISGKVIIPKYETVGERILSEQKQLKMLETDQPALEASAETSGHSARIMSVYNEVMESIAAYENDIVKIIKYPAMTDRGNSSTREMTLAAKTAQRLLMDPKCTQEEFEGAVKDLETKFLIAESYALKTASTELSEAEQKKVQKAKDLLAIASNEASSEQEKKVSFKQAFKQLEGVVVVPEVAVDTFRVKIGLREIEA